jgi:peptidoglycan-associated lipoprotein
MPMRNLSFVLSAFAALSLAAAGCGKKAVKQPTATATSKPAPGPSKKAKPADVGDASLTTDDTSGTAPPSGPIFFEFDSSTLTKESRDLLATFATWAIEKKPKLRIEGHTDERGTTEYNLALGDRRARVIADYLTDLGVDATRIDTVTFGEEKPASDGHDEEAWAANRRGEVKQ